MLLSFFTSISTFAQEEFTKYIDLTIGHVAQFLVPTYSTIHLPDSMLPVYPERSAFVSVKLNRTRVAATLFGRIISELKNCLD